MHRSPQLAASGCTHRGRVRAHNEDAFGYSLDFGCFVVCDGLGGAAGGAVASGIAVSTVLDRLTTPSALGPGRRLERAICAANREILAHAGREQSLEGMGTTLVAMLLASGGLEAAARNAKPLRALVAHVGDSRLYLYRAGELARVTADHSLVAEQVRLGQLSADEAARSPMRHVITRALGLHRAVLAETTELALEPGDRVLLCSDGLTNELGEPEIAEVLDQARDQARDQAPDQARDQALGAACETLITRALAHGGRDNVSCLLVEVD